MTADYLQFQTASLQLPLPSSTANPILLDADPVMYYMLDFFSNVITLDVGSRLLAQASAYSISGITSAVQQRYPSAIDAYKLENQFQFPLLVVHRTRSEYTKHSSSYYTDQCWFDLMYILPPLTQAQAENILPIMRAVEVTIRDRCVQGWDPEYTPPSGMQGDQPWAALYAHVQAIGFVSGAHGTLTHNGQLFFPCLTMTGYVQERQNYIALSTIFAGGDVTGQSVAPDGTTSPFEVQTSTQQAPTITSLSVTSGTYLGGTAVTITGTLFENMATVYFGNNEALAVSTVSATEITCVTPAMSGTGSVSVTVVNVDGQTATSTFTFD